jgi:hypothetical protein
MGGGNLGLVGRTKPSTDDERRRRDIGGIYSMQKTTDSRQNVNQAVVRLEMSTEAPTNDEQPEMANMRDHSLS